MWWNPQKWWETNAPSSNRGHSIDLFALCQKESSFQTEFLTLRYFVQLLHVNWYTCVYFTKLRWIIDIYTLLYIKCSPDGSVVKNLPANAGDMDLVPGLGRSPGEELATHSTPIFLPGNLHGQRSLVGYSLWGRKESDTTKWLRTSTCINYITNRNLLYSAGNPTQYSVRTYMGKEPKKEWIYVYV